MDLASENKILRTKITRLEKFIMDQDKMLTSLKDSVKKKMYPKVHLYDLSCENNKLKAKVSNLEKAILKMNCIQILQKKKCDDLQQHVKEETQLVPEKVLMKNAIYEDISDDEMDDNDKKFNAMKAEIVQLKKVIEIKEKALINVKELEKHFLKLTNEYKNLEDEVVKLKNENSKLSKICEDYRFEMQITSNVNTKTNTCTKCESHEETIFDIDSQLKKLKAENNVNKKVILNLKHKNFEMTKTKQENNFLLISGIIYKTVSESRVVAIKTIQENNS